MDINGFFIYKRKVKRNINNIIVLIYEHVSSFPIKQSQYSGKYF